MLRHELLDEHLSDAEARTFDLRISCTCSQPQHCNRFHGLPMPNVAFALHTNDVEKLRKRAELYDLYDAAYVSGKDLNRAELFCALTAPFNNYRAHSA